MFGKLAIILSVALFLVLVLPGQVSAKSLRRAVSVSTPTSSPTPQIQFREVQYEKVNPDNGSNYLVKRLKEKIAMIFAFSDKSKVELNRRLVEARFSELKYTIDNKQMAFFEKATQRYFTNAGQLTELLTSKKMTSDYETTKELLNSHIPVLTQLRDTYNPTTAEWRFVEDDINYVKADIKKLSQ